MKIYQKIAGLVKARRNCERMENWEWFDKHEETLSEMEREFLPSGSGFDSGCSVNFEKSGKWLYIDCPFHVMNETGYYTGWHNFTVIVKPDLISDIDLSINWYGPADGETDIDGLKEYILDTIHVALTQKI